MKNLVSLAAIVVALPVPSALAADLPSRKEPVITPIAIPVWSGLHVGFNAGGTWANSGTIGTASSSFYISPVDPPANRAGPADHALAAALGASSSLSNGGSSGFIGGGQIGYDIQFGGRFANAVAGVEADIQGIAGGSGSSTNYFSAIPVPQSNPARLVTTLMSGGASLSYLGTVRGRIGYAVMPTVLVYGTGGLAYGGVNANVNGVQAYDPVAINRTVAGFGGGSYSNTQVGWTAGGGAEWMFLPNWSAKAEYLYYDLGSVRFNAGTSTATDTGVGGAGLLWANTVQAQTKFTGNIVRAGVNYHFNFASAPVVAKF
jgi:outer membrane immunogenic protein